MFASLIYRNRGTQHRSAPKATFRPRMDGMEDRSVPAVVSITENLITHVVTIEGNSGAENIILTDNGTTGITLTGAGIVSPKVFEPNTLRIVYNANGGNDTLTYNLTGTKTRGVAIEPNLGAGTDTFIANLNGRTIQNNSKLSFKVRAGDGSDTVTINAGTAAAPTNVRAGSNLYLDLDGGGGPSVLDNADGNDNIRVTYQGDLDGNLELKVSGGIGADTLTVLATLNAGSTGRVKGLGVGGATAKVDGGIGGDVIDFRVRDNSGGTANVNARAESGVDIVKDIVRHTANVTLLGLGIIDDNIVVT